MIYKATGGGFVRFVQQCANQQSHAEAAECWLVSSAEDEQQAEKESQHERQDEEVAEPAHDEHRAGQIWIVASVAAEPTV